MQLIEQRDIERFYAKVDTSGDCHLWTAAVDEQQYGLVKWGGKSVRAHRVAYIIAHGSIPDGLQIDHLCRNHRCVRVSHLEAVTQTVNVRRGLMGALRTRCKQGHTYSEANTYRDKQGHRKCRACMRVSSAKQLAKRHQRASATCG